MQTMREFLLSNLVIRVKECQIRRGEGLALIRKVLDGLG